MDQDRVARADQPTVAVEFYLARAFQDEINFLRHLVIVTLCTASCVDPRFCKALILDGRVRTIEKGADGRAGLLLTGTARGAPASDSP